MRTRKSNIKSKNFNKRFIKTHSKRQRGGTNNNINLIVASRYGDTEIVAMLLEKGDDVNAKDDSGWTALIVASFYGHPEMVEMLLNNGSDVNAKNNDGYTALIMASERGRPEIVSILLANGADVNATDDNGYTSLMWAVKFGHTLIVELLEKAIETETKIRGYKQAAMELVRHRDVKIPSLRTLSYRQLPTYTTTEINGYDLLPPSKLCGKRRRESIREKSQK